MRVWLEIPDDINRDEFKSRCEQILREMERDARELARRHLVLNDDAEMVKYVNDRCLFEGHLAKCPPSCKPIRTKPCGQRKSVSVIGATIERQSPCVDRKKSWLLGTVAAQ